MSSPSPQHRTPSSWGRRQTKPQLRADGDAREAVKALIVANQFLETELEKPRVAVSTGYLRGKLLPQDRKDWYDWGL